MVFYTVRNNDIGYTDESYFVDYYQPVSDDLIFTSKIMGKWVLGDLYSHYSIMKCPLKLVFPAPWFINNIVIFCKKIQHHIIKVEKIKPFIEYGYFFIISAFAEAIVHKKLAKKNPMTNYIINFMFFFLWKNSYFNKKYCSSKYHLLRIIL